MAGEILVEEGIVVSVAEGTAHVAVTQSESCEDCSAKIICKPKSENEKIIKVEDPLGVKPGDKVRIEVEGGALLSASFFLYGVPLILFLVGIFSGMSIFSNYAAKELYSFLFGIGLITVYYIINFLKKTSSKPKLPKIVSVNRNI